VWGRMDTCIYLTGSPSLTVQLKLSEHCLLIASVCVCTKSLQSCLTLCDSMGCSLPGSSGRKESWNGRPCPPPGDRLNPGIQPKSPVAPVLQADLFFFFLTTEPPGNPLIFYSAIQNKFKKKNKTQEGGTYLLGSPP